MGRRLLRPLYLSRGSCAIRCASMGPACNLNLLTSQGLKTKARVVVLFLLSAAAASLSMRARLACVWQANVKRRQPVSQCKHKVNDANVQLCLYKQAAAHRIRARTHARPVPPSYHQCLDTLAKTAPPRPAPVRYANLERRPGRPASGGVAPTLCLIEPSAGARGAAATPHPPGHRAPPAPGRRADYVIDLASRLTSAPARPDHDDQLERIND